MPNHVETRMWLLSKDCREITDQEIESFFSQFITVYQETDGREDPRHFDFNTLVPHPENLWHGAVGGDEEENIALIEKYGGLEAVNKAFKEHKPFPAEKQPCLTDEQIIKFGMVNGLDWNRDNWETKWGAYDSQFDWSARYGGKGYAQVAFYTAWSIPEKILRLIRGKALEQGYEIECEFGGELDQPGVYTNGAFMYWEGEWNEETETLEHIGEPLMVHT